MAWYVVCLRPSIQSKVERFPFCVGRDKEVSPSCVVIDSPYVSRVQFSLEKVLGNVFYVNKSAENPGELDGSCVTGNKRLSTSKPHIVRFGDNVVMGFGTDYSSTYAAVFANTPELYYVQTDGKDEGPFTGEELVEECESGRFARVDIVKEIHHPENLMRMDEIVDYGDEESGDSLSVPVDRPAVKRQFTAEESVAVPGESFMCPYCRTISYMEDVLSVSVSPGLMGDSVLGEGEQKRFLPSQFTGNGLAIDSEGGVCTEIACPRCHMSLPRMLLDTPQMVMSVVGAAGSGKSVFLASSMWQCRQTLSRLFGVSFMDLDPVANRWINAYEEKLFFQEDGTSLQQIEKTDLQASNVSRYVMLDGDRVLLPLPSFFQLYKPGYGQPQSLVVYDSAGEHFRAGADTSTSAVTLNMLNADTLFFMFDPSADPRFRPFLYRGDGTAHNYAQRQDVLLSEMSARIRRHLGNRGESRLSKPLVVGVSKADLLRGQLPLDSSIYRGDSSQQYSLDLYALREVSRQTEALLGKVSPEVVNTAHDIASDVWFVPVSALGHNPMKEGVRPCDIKPIWTELPVVFTLAKKGLIPVCGEW